MSASRYRQDQHTYDPPLDLDAYSQGIGGQRLLAMAGSKLRDVMALIAIHPQYQPRSITL